MTTPRRALAPVALSSLAAMALAVVVGAAACAQSRNNGAPPQPNGSEGDARGDALAQSQAPTPAPAPTRAPITEPPPGDAAAELDDGAAADDAMAGHVETTEDLLRLVSFPELAPNDPRQKTRSAYLLANFGPGPGRFNQGNRALAHHSIGKKRCLEGLKDIVLQTEEQRAICGADYMVPVYKGGDPKSAKFCIDIFEFPNRPCELPMVWTAPAVTVTVCAMQGKRLCSQDEWNLACRADPAGGPDTIYAYGNELDLAVCNTSKPHPSTNGQWDCRTRDAQVTWKTCSTDTEPAGAFPKCRSRFGVFDQHGNVAEVMTRKDPELGMVDQLKGSAFFYVDVARKHNEPQAKDAPRETYPDHCNYDPRWHVEKLETAMHVNYHLGFRCCKSI